jgi:hypothetical protein
MNRRDLLIASATVTGSALTMRFQQRKYSRDSGPKRSRVAILKADKYSDSLDELVYDGLRLFNLKVRGKSVLLKPNIVEYIPGRPVNTDTHLVGAAAEAFLRLGAASVTVGEGPGHHRDTELLLYETGSATSLSTAKPHSWISIATSSSKPNFKRTIPVLTICGSHGWSWPLTSSFPCPK